MRRKILRKILRKIGRMASAYQGRLNLTEGFILALFAALTVTFFRDKGWQEGLLYGSLYATVHLLRLFEPEVNRFFQQIRSTRRRRALLWTAAGLTPPIIAWFMGAGGVREAVIAGYLPLFLFGVFAVIVLIPLLLWDWFLARLDKKEN